MRFRRGPPRREAVKRILYTRPGRFDRMQQGGDGVEVRPGVTVRVGLFDSGVGGLSVWREIASMRPDFETLYVADQAHIPYGARSTSEIRTWSLAIARFLVAQGCDVIVVACNTASAAAL